MRVRPRGQADEHSVEDFLRRQDALLNARRGEVVPAMDHPALVAEDAGRIAGVLTYVIRGDECEVLTLHSEQRWAGVGTALLREVERLAREQGCRKVWLVTTNDNVDALRFYQRRGLRIYAVRIGAVDEARARLKAQIPEVGAYGIPLRDEIELSKDL